MINLDEAKRWADFLGDKHSFVNLQHRKGAAEMIRALVAKVQELDEQQCSRKPPPEHYTALEQSLTRLQKRYAELEGKVSKPLTDEDILKISDDIERSDFFDIVIPFARAIEAAHGIKEQA